MQKKKRTAMTERTMTTMPQETPNILKMHAAMSLLKRGKNIENGNILHGYHHKKKIVKQFACFLIRVKFDIMVSILKAYKPTTPTMTQMAIFQPVERLIQ